MPNPERTSHINPESQIGAAYRDNIRENSDQLNLSFKNALEPQDSFDWIGSFKSNLKLSKRTDQNWSTKLAESYFKELNRRSIKFNSLTHDYDKLFVNEDNKILFLDKLSSLIQNLVYKRGDKEKTPILVLENQNPLIQNYIKIAHKNLGIEGPGNESLDLSGSSANDGKKINEITAIAREKIKFLVDFLKGHYRIDDVNINKELEEIKSFLKENENHAGATSSTSSTNRDPQSPSFLRSPPSSKSPSFPKTPSAFSPSQSPASPLNSKKVGLENLLKELKKIYDKTKYSQSRAELFAGPETPSTQSNEALECMQESFVGKHLPSRLGSFADPETPSAQSPEANKLFAAPETPRAQLPSSSPSTETLPSKKLLFNDVRESSR